MERRRSRRREGNNCSSNNCRVSAADRPTKTLEELARAKVKEWIEQQEEYDDVNTNVVEDGGAAVVAPPAPAPAPAPALDNGGGKISHEEHRLAEGGESDEMSEKGRRERKRQPPPDPPSTATRAAAAPARAETELEEEVRDFLVQDYTRQLEEGRVGALVEEEGGEGGKEGEKEGGKEGGKEGAMDVSPEWTYREAVSFLEEEEGKPLACWPIHAFDTTAQHTNHRNNDATFNSMVIPLFCLCLSSRVLVHSLDFIPRSNLPSPSLPFLPSPPPPPSLPTHTW